MKKLFFLVTAILVICAVGLVQPVAAETLRVGCECTYFPFNYRGDDGVLAGYDIDVATGIAKRIGADFWPTSSISSQHPCPLPRND